MLGNLSESDLVLNPDGSVYHLHLTNDDIADTVIFVGNPKRVKRISKHFDKVEKSIENREFVTHTGNLGNKRITVIGSGIGTDNMDIALNEIYAATHVDSRTRKSVNRGRKLNMIRLGTSGAIQPDLETGSFIASEFGMGVDGLLYYYDYEFSPAESVLNASLGRQSNWPNQLSKPYFVQADASLLDTMANELKKGITISATGFYGPQGRFLKNQRAEFNLYETTQKLDLENLRVTNFDMETAALYGLGKFFGFRCLTINVIIANRATGTFTNDPSQDVDALIAYALERLQLIQ